MKLGAYTACLHDRPLPEALDVLKSNGLTSVEVNTGGFIPSPHCHLDLLLSSEQARRDYLGVFASRGMELTGLNCNGNPLNPLPGVGPKHADDLRRTIKLAGLLGVRNVVTMFGHPRLGPRREVSVLGGEPLGRGLHGRAGLPVGRGRRVLDRDRRARQGQRRQGRHRDAPAQPGFLPGHAEEAGGPDQRAERRSRDGPLPPDVAGHGRRRIHPLAGPPGVPCRRQGRHDHSGRGHPRRPRHLVRASARGRPGQGPHRHRILVQRLAGRTLPGDSSRSASATMSPTGPNSSPHSPTSTPTSPSTSSTRTPTTPASTASPSPQRT